MQAANVIAQAMRHFESYTEIFRHIQDQPKDFRVSAATAGGMESPRKLDPFRIDPTYMSNAVVKAREVHERLVAFEESKAAYQRILQANLDDMRDLTDADLAVEETKLMEAFQGQHRASDALRTDIVAFSDLFAGAIQHSP